MPAFAVRVRLGLILFLPVAFFCVYIRFFITSNRALKLSVCIYLFFSASLIGTIRSTLYCLFTFVDLLFVTQFNYTLFFAIP